MRNIKLAGVLLSGFIFVGCGGGSSTAGSTSAFFEIDGGMNVVVDGQETYSGSYDSFLTVGNNPNSVDSISEVYSNPVTADTGPNRITAPMPPGYEHGFRTSNCNQDYFLEADFENGDYASLVYYRACGYDYYFLFENGEHGY